MINVYEQKKLIAVVHSKRAASAVGIVLRDHAAGKITRETRVKMIALISKDRGLR